MWPSLVSYLISNSYGASTAKFAVLLAGHWEVVVPGGGQGRMYNNVRLSLRCPKPLLLPCPEAGGSMFPRNIGYVLSISVPRDATIHSSFFVYWTVHQCDS